MSTSTKRPILHFLRPTIHVPVISIPDSFLTSYPFFSPQVSRTRARKIVWINFR